MKEYILKMVTFGGSVSTKIFTNKREAKSYAWNWINAQKRYIRDRNNDRNYEELQAIITHWSGYENNSDQVIDAMYN